MAENPNASTLRWEPLYSPAPAGLFFYLGLRSHTPMDPDLENVIRQTLADAQTAGRDHLSQTELAVRAVLQLVPLLASRLAALGRPSPGLRIHKHDTTCR